MTISIDCVYLCVVPFYAHDLISQQSRKLWIKHIERRLQRTVNLGSFKKQTKRLLFSKTALAIPVTYLILFVSLILLISTTYSVAVLKIGARGTVLRNSVAKQNMQFLDDAIRSVAWSFGASEAVFMDNCGASFQIAATAKSLTINFTDERTFSDIVFNNSIGRAFYELETQEFSFDNSFIRGDDRAIINQSSFTMTQLYVDTNNYRELVLCYRPSVTGAEAGIANGKPLNLVRVYVINLNSSRNLLLGEKFYLKITSLNVTTVSSQYEFNSSVSSLALKAVFDGTSSTVWLPISSNETGSAVTMEIVVCNIKIQEAEV